LSNEEKNYLLKKLHAKGSSYDGGYYHDQNNKAKAFAVPKPLTVFTALIDTIKIHATNPIATIAIKPTYIKWNHDKWNHHK
jgi:hypothetical protein